MSLRTLKLTPEDRLSSKRLTKDAAVRNLSTDQEYHGDTSVSVPFNWESQPGTPKVKFRQSNLPPLTPPPSYFYKTCTPRKPTKKLSRSNILNSIFPKVSTSSHNPISPPSSSLSSSSSSSFGSSSPCSTIYSPRLRKSHRGSGTPPNSRKQNSNSRIMDEEEQENEPPIASFCFGYGREVKASSRGRYASMIKVLFRDI